MDISFDRMDNDSLESWENDFIESSSSEDILTVSGEDKWFERTVAMNGERKEYKGEEEWLQRALSVQMSTPTRPQPLTFNQPSQPYPTRRRPSMRSLSEEKESVISEWFQKSKITIGENLPDDLKARAERLIYTWRDCFAFTLMELEATDLIEHTIDLVKDHQPFRAKVPLWTPKETEFAAKVFPEMVKAGIMSRVDCEYGARTKFPPKKSGELRIVHNYIRLNKDTIKSGYPTSRIEPVVNTIFKGGNNLFCVNDGAHGYWGIPLRRGDEVKTATVTPIGLFCYNRMSMGLKGSMHTYCRFVDLVFGDIPEVSIDGGILPGEERLWGDHGTVTMHYFVDDNYVASNPGRRPGKVVGSDQRPEQVVESHEDGIRRSFDHMFDFLQTRYFPRLRWARLYLTPKKASFFVERAECVGFEGSASGVRPSIRMRTKLAEWPHPTTPDELESFNYITPWLRRWISGRAEHTRIMKEAWVEIEDEEKTTTPPLKPDDGLDLEWTLFEKPPKKSKKTGRLYQVGKRGWWRWGAKQKASFNSVVNDVVNRAMTSGEPKIQYHLVTDASKTGIGGILFQMPDIEAGVEATLKNKGAERIIMFISFKLADAETRYTTTEREALAVVRCLAEVRWLVHGSPFPVKIYTDHSALLKVFGKGADDSHSRIARWQDRLGEYDFEVHHRPATDRLIQIADGLSRMPTCYQTPTFVKDVGRPQPMAIAMAAFGISADCLEQWQLSEEDGNLTLLQERQWRKYLNSEFYGDEIAYLLWGQGALRSKGMTANQIKVVMRSADRKVMLEGGRGLYHRDSNGQFAKCILESEVDQALFWAHDTHGHFSIEPTVARLVGEMYWPTRHKDTANFVSSCHTCQLTGPKRRTQQLKPILKMQPQDMAALDLLGPVNPACPATGHKYVAVYVDYHTRFTIARSIPRANQESVMTFLEESVFSFLGCPVVIYTDNGSCFTSSEIEEFYKEYNIRRIPAPPYHPSSVGLAERHVQMVKSYIRGEFLQKGFHPKTGWSGYARDSGFEISTRRMKISGYSPAEIMMGIRPRGRGGGEDMRSEIIRVLSGETDQNTGQRSDPDESTIKEWERNVHLAFLEEVRSETLVSRAGEQAKMQAAHRQRLDKSYYASPEPGNLVLVRRFELDGQKGRKLEAQWSEPKLLIGISPSTVTGYVKDLHGTDIKKYHLDDLKIYRSRAKEAFMVVEGYTKVPRVWYSREAMKYADSDPSVKALYF
ncbi:Protease [Dactylella cylindrospora]|nr:Protease [Dactylella cylindrospora]